MKRHQVLWRLRELQAACARLIPDTAGGRSSEELMVALAVQFRDLSALVAQLELGLAKRKSRRILH